MKYYKEQILCLSLFVFLLLLATYTEYNGLNQLTGCIILFELFIIVWAMYLITER